MNGMKNNIALDTNIFIYHFEKDPQFFIFTKKIFNTLEADKYNAITSIISLTELLSVPMSVERIHALRDIFFETPHLTTYSVSEAIAFEAARIRREYRFRLPDAIQLATSLYAKSDRFVTNDQRLQAFKEVPIVLLPTFSH